MTETKQTSTTRADRRPDCVTEIRMGNSVLTVSGFFKQDATDTAADKMWGCWKPKPQPPTSRPIPNEPGVRKAVMPGNMSVEMTEELLN